MDEQAVSQDHDGDEIKALGIARTAFHVANTLRPTAVAAAKLAGKAACPAIVDRELTPIDHPPVVAADWRELYKQVASDDDEVPATAAEAIEDPQLRCESRSTPDTRNPPRPYLALTSTDDMSTPVTRGELREELQHLEQKFEQKLEQKLALVATKAELEIWGGALLARIESGEQRLLERMDVSEQRLLAELARHTRASYEDASTQISAIDDKYADLSARVSQLEVSVFPTNRR